MTCENYVSFILKEKRLEPNIQANIWLTITQSRTPNSTTPRIAEIISIVTKVINQTKVSVLSLTKIEIGLLVHF